MTFLDRAEARLVGISPQPWSYSTVDSIGGGSLYDVTRTIASLHYESPSENNGRIVRLLPTHEADANGLFIAHAPGDIAAFLEFARAVREVIHDPRSAWSALHVVRIDQALVRLEDRP